MCVSVCVLGGCVKVRGQLCGVCSLLLSRGSRMEVRFSSLVVYALTVMPRTGPRQVKTGFLEMKIIRVVSTSLFFKLP